VESMEHEVWIEAATEHVFDALTTKQGLDRWWGPVITAEPRVGSVVEFDHGLGDPLRMEITDLVPNARVTWRCVSEFHDATNPASEWTGQTLQFDLTPRTEVELLGRKQRATIVRLRVTGWPRTHAGTAFATLRGDRRSAST
jgi:uncharacterized protein YndB with AHSA1/START domain